MKYLLPLFCLSTGCSSGGADSSDSGLGICGDIDGDGTDTGNIPNILGLWTASFGTNNFTENCGLSGFSDSSESWLNGTMEIKGRVPDGLYAIFDDEEERFHGLESAHGGLVLSGTHTHAQFGTMWVSMGGLIYDDAYRGRVVIEGFGFLGLDTMGDGEIDCYARGDFEAFKSGV